MTHLDKVTEHIRGLMLKTKDANEIEKLAKSLEVLSLVSRNDVETMQQLEYLTMSRQNKGPLIPSTWTATGSTFNNQV